MKCQHPMCNNHFEPEGQQIYCEECRTDDTARINKNKAYAFANSYGNPEVKIEDGILKAKFCGIWLTDSNFDLHHLEEGTKCYNVMKYITTASCRPQSCLNEIKKTVMLPKFIHALLSRVQLKLRFNKKPEYDFDSIIKRIEADLGQFPDFNKKECEELIRFVLNRIYQEFEYEKNSLQINKSVA